VRLALRDRARHRTRTALRRSRAFGFTIGSEYGHTGYFGAQGDRLWTLIVFIAVDEDGPVHALGVLSAAVFADLALDPS
jgi:hypothetical protein